MARAMGTNAYGKEPRRGERTLSRGIHPSPGTKGLLTPLRGWRVSGPVPQGLRPGLFSRAPNGASNRARTRLARREELGIKAQTRVENVETPDAPMNGGGPEGTPAWKAALQVADQRHVAGGVEGELGLAAGDGDALAFLHAALLVGHPDAKLFHLRGQASDGGRDAGVQVDFVEREGL